MKVDAVEISRVANGYIIRLTNYGHSEDSAFEVWIAPTLQEALEGARKAFMRT